MVAKGFSQIPSMDFKSSLPSPTHSTWNLWNPCRISMDSVWIPGIPVDKKMGVFPAKNVQGIHAESAQIPWKFRGTGLPGVHKDSMDSAWIPHAFHPCRMCGSGAAFTLPWILCGIHMESRCFRPNNIRNKFEKKSKSHVT